MRKPYLVRTPNFDPTSGGIRVMYGLYGWLLARGEIVYLNAQMPNVETIGIYPEIYSGNDQNATKVVRWILQTPGIMSTGNAPSPSTEEIKATSDDVYVFSKVYDTIGVDDDHIMFLPIINMHLFKDEGKHRTKTAYLVGKGVNQHKHPSTAVEITREFAQDQQALAELLNKCKVLYCYDRLSAMMDIARLCGCRVQYYGELSPKELSLYETGLNGLGYQDEKVTLASESFREHYEQMVKDFERKLDLFIINTQNL